MVLSRNFVEEIQQRTAREVSEAVVRENVEERNDLVDVRAHQLPYFGLRQPVRFCMCIHRARDVRIRQQQLTDARALSELEPVQSRAALFYRAEGASVYPIAKK